MRAQCVVWTCSRGRRSLVRPLCSAWLCDQSSSSGDLRAAIRSMQFEVQSGTAQSKAEWRRQRGRGKSGARTASSKADANVSAK